MDEQRVSNLEGMDEQGAQQFLAELFSHLSPEEEYEVRHTMEMPQSGERYGARWHDERIPEPRARFGLGP